MGIKKKVKAGVLADDLEFALLSLKNGELPAEIVYFVDKANVAPAVLPKYASIVYYSFKKEYKADSSKDFLKSVIGNSNFTEVAKKEKISNFWFSLNQENIDVLNLWALKNKFSLIGNPDLIKKLENKIFFDKFLAKHNIKKPKSKEIFYKKGENILFKYPFVLQNPVSSGGEGTFFIKNKRDIEHLDNSGLKNGSKALLREYIYGKPCGITLFIDDSCTICSSVRLQCFKAGGTHDVSPDQVGTTSGVVPAFMGVQFLPYSFFNKKEIEEINKTFLKISTVFKRNKWFGLFNFDFIISKSGEVYLIECNPRISAASALLFNFPELNNGFDIAQVFLESLFSKEKHLTEKKVFCGLPETQFQGSVFYPGIEIPQGKTVKINNIFKEGVYRQIKNNISFLSCDLSKISLAGEKFILKNEVSKGEVCENNLTFASVVSNYPLFDFEGNISENAKNIISAFNYVDKK